MFATIKVAGRHIARVKIPHVWQSWSHTHTNTHTSALITVKLSRQCDSLTGTQLSIILWGSLVESVKQCGFVIVWETDREKQGVYVHAHLFVITMQLVLDTRATRSAEPLPPTPAAWPGSERTLTYESWVLSSLVSVYRVVRAKPCRPLALHHSSLHVGQTEVNGLKGITLP